jgi:MFS family permease
MYFLGFCVTGTIIILYVYVRDFLPEDEKKLFGTLVNLIDGSTLFWSSFYFLYIPYWKPLFIFAISMQLFVIIGLLFIPESPIVLYETRQYEEARDVYSVIAKRNKVDNYEIDF